MSGHDYQFQYQAGGDGYMRSEVKDAVDEFAAAQNLRVYSTSERSPAELYFLKREPGEHPENVVKEPLALAAHTLSQSFSLSHAARALVAPVAQITFPFCRRRREEGVADPDEEAPNRWTREERQRR